MKNTKSIIEILEIASYKYSKIVAYENGDSNKDNYLMIVDTKIHPLTIICGKFGLTKVFKGKLSKKYMHKDIVKFLDSELKTQSMWIEKFNKETRTKQNCGMRDLKSDYLNVTVLRKLSEFDFEVTENNRVFLHNNKYVKNNFNKGFSDFLQRHGFAKKFFDGNIEHSARLAVNYKLLDYVSEKLINNERFVEAFSIVQ